MRQQRNDDDDYNVFVVDEEWNLNVDTFTLLSLSLSLSDHDQAITSLFLDLLRSNGATYKRIKNYLYDACAFGFPYTAKAAWDKMVNIGIKRAITGDVCAWIFGQALQREQQQWQVSKRQSQQLKQQHH